MAKWDVAWVVPPKREGNMNLSSGFVRGLEANNEHEARALTIQGVDGMLIEVGAFLPTDRFTIEVGSPQLLDSEHCS